MPDTTSSFDGWSQQYLTPEDENVTKARLMVPVSEVDVGSKGVDEATPDIFHRRHVGFVRWEGQDETIDLTCRTTIWIAI